jgi:hypothetical protein
MVSAVEEKLARLYALPEWTTFTPQQQTFLTEFAKTGEARASYGVAYPNARQQTWGYGSAQLINQQRMRCAIKAARLGKEDTDLVSKEEAIGMLSRTLRQVQDETEMFVKVFALYAKMNGWDKQPKGEGSNPDSSEEPALDDVVAALKKERNNGGEENRES